MDLYRRAEVVRMEVTPRSDGSWAIEGEVQGSLPAPYQVLVHLMLAPNGQVKH